MWEHAASLFRVFRITGSANGAFSAVLADCKAGISGFQARMEEAVSDIYSGGLCIQCIPFFCSH